MARHPVKQFKVIVERTLTQRITYYQRTTSRGSAIGGALGQAMNAAESEWTTDTEKTTTPRVSVE